MNTTPAGRHTLPLRETTDAELVEAAERMDAGCRLVVPMLFDGIGPDPQPGDTEHLPIEDAPVTVVPEIDEVLLVNVAAKVGEFRDDAMRDLHHLDKRAPRHVYIEALQIVAGLDEFLMTVREYVGGRS